MFSLFITEPVVVIRKESQFDKLGEPTVVATEREDVKGVLVCPGSTSDLDASRPNGATVAFTLHFPKDYTKSLKDCLVEVRGKEYVVIGDPQSYTVQNTPGEWNLTVEVSRTDG